MAKAAAHDWEWKPRFRRNAFGWKSQPAVTRVKQAVAEIKKVARKEPVVAAEGAVMFLERLSPALERIDSSSGAIGSAVNRAIDDLVPLIADAPCDTKTRAAWLERLHEAEAADQIPYLEGLGDHWGELCASKETASLWADRLIGITRMALSPDRNLRGHFHGTSACLSALHRAERFDELIDILRADVIWPYKQWAVRALAASGRRAEALRLAESCRGPYASDHEIDSACEEILIASGMADEAYARYGVTANRRATYLATFRAVAQKYPHKTASEILADLAASTPGEEGKWFSAAKEAGLYEEALTLASRSPCDPRTLARAARDFAEEQPAFAVVSGLLALQWIALGHGYDMTAGDVIAVHRSTMAAAETLGSVAKVEKRLAEMVAAEGPDAAFVARALAGRLRR